MRSRSPSTKDRYYKKKVKSNYIKFKQPIHKSEVKLDLFKEKEKLLLVGEFPGLSEGDLLININPNSLKVLTKPEALRCYYASMELPEAFETYIKEKSLRNGIMALILEQVAYEKVPEPLQEIFNDCLSLYPELAQTSLDFLPINFLVALVVLTPVFALDIFAFLVVTLSAYFGLLKYSIAPFDCLSDEFLHKVKLLGYLSLYSFVFIL